MPLTSSTPFPPAAGPAAAAQHHARCLECSASAYLQLLCAGDPATLLPRLLGEVRLAFNAQRAGYALREAGAHECWLLAEAQGPAEAGGAPPSEPWRVFDFAAAGMGRVLAELNAGREICCLREELPAVEQASPELQALHYVMALPVRRGGETAGCLLLGFDAEHGAPGPDELRLLRSLPAAIGAALERHLTESLLGEAHIELSNILRSSTEYALLATDLQLRVLRCNPLAEAMFEQLAHCGPGASLAETDILRLIGVDLPALREAAAAGQSWEVEHAAALGYGAQTLHTIVSGMRNMQDELCGYLIVTRDVTELRAQDRRLLEQQRMQSIGLLAGGVAHDFNNILMGILGYSSLAKDRLEPEHPAYRMLSTIEQSAERAADLTRALLAYARGGKNETLPVMLDVMAEELLDILRTNLPKGVVIEKQFPGRLPYVLADPAQIQQVVMNLCLNAGEAIQQKKTLPAHAEMTGKLDLRAGARRLDTAQCAQLGLSEEQAGREFAFLEVTDNGCGMSAETIQRIFEPFFTTKFAGRGLGLAAVEGIVRNHGGSLQVTSAAGVGTTFVLYLPSAGYMEQEENQAASLALGQGETILVVDDEEVVGQLALLTLTNLGYQVMLAHDGAEGLAAYREHGAQIGVLLLDITMPGRSGTDLLDSFLELKPGTPVLLTSGFDEAATAGLVRAGKAAGFLRKPYTPETLARAVSTVLDRVPE